MTYNTLAPGIALTATGATLLGSSGLMLGLDYRTVHKGGQYAMLAFGWVW